MFQLKRRLYENAPLPIKMGIGSIPFAWLAGRSYRETWKRTGNLEFETTAQLNRLRKQLLRSLLEYACEFVPAYRRYRSCVERYEPEEALIEFPILDKQTLKANFKNYISTAASVFRCWESSTGGTSGDQLTFLLDDGAQSREMAFMHRLWSRVGYTPRHRKATFRGVSFSKLSEEKYWQLNPIYNECQFSPFHLSDSALPKYISQLRSYRPGFLHGYPSAISEIARYCLWNETRLDDIGLRALLLGSESSYPEQREQMADAFGARPFSWYGHSERIILAGECEHSNAYHHFPDYGFLEILDGQGRAVQEGETGEIVGTGFWNRVMPLIRYQIGDRARKLPRSCSCGRSFERFDNVEGRWEQEYIVGKNGARISIAALNMHGPLFQNVTRYQYFQNEPGLLQLRLMANERFDADDERALLEAFQLRVRNELEVHAKIVDEIPLTSRGKLRRLIQDIPREANAAANVK